MFRRGWENGGGLISKLEISYRVWADDLRQILYEKEITGS
jgi:hypothetical protein